MKPTTQSPTSAPRRMNGLQMHKVALARGRTGHIRCQLLQHIAKYDLNGDVLKIHYFGSDVQDVAVHSCETPHCSFMRRQEAAQVAPL
jgi:hypothetical protein